MSSSANPENRGVVRPWPLEVCIESVRLLIPDAPVLEVQARAEQMRSEIAATADHEDRVAKAVSELPAQNRPVDQGRPPTEEEKKKHIFVNSRWSLVRRWPWIAVWEDDWDDAGRPPWLIAIPYRGHHQAITNCLLYCIRNSEYLPRFTPFRGELFHGPASNPTELPLINMVGGRWIPRGLVKQYPTARCGEALAFVFNFHGSSDMEEIRKLIVAPTPEKVAQAYAIATSQMFQRGRLVERELAKSDEAEAAPKMLAMKHLQATYSSVLGEAGPSAVLHVLLLAPYKIWHARTLSGSPELRDSYKNKSDKDSDLSRSVGRWLKSLAGEGLAEQMGKGKGWKAGPKCFA